MRDCLKRLKIAWLVLTNTYCNDDTHQCWYLGDNILITFDKETYQGRSCGFCKLCKCKWKKK